MTTAAVISCEEARLALAKTRARQQRHEPLDGGWERWEAQVPNDRPSLEEWTQGVFARRQALTGRITDALVAQSHTSMLPQRTRRCPDGDRLLPARPAPPRTGPTRVGEVSLSRPDVYGISGQPGVAPLDDARQRSERRVQGDLPQAAARLAAEVPVTTAQALLTPLTGLSWSAPTLHAGAGELSHALGVLEVRPTAAASGHRGAEMAAGQTWRPVLGWALEGADVPTRPEPAKEPATGRRCRRARRAGGQGEGQEAQGVRFSLGDPERRVPLLRW
jgi:hypothetical protein